MDHQVSREGEKTPNPRRRAGTRSTKPAASFSLRWDQHGEIYRLLDSSGYVRAFVWMEDALIYWSVSGLGLTNANIRELRGSNKKQLQRKIEAHVRGLLGPKSGARRDGV